MSPSHSLCTIKWGGGQWGRAMGGPMLWMGGGGGGGQADQSPHSYATAVYVVNNRHCIVLGKLYLRVNIPSSFWQARSRAQPLAWPMMRQGLVGTARSGQVRVFNVHIQSRASCYSAFAGSSVRDRKKGGRGTAFTDGYKGVQAVRLGSVAGGVYLRCYGIWNVP